VEERKWRIETAPGTLQAKDKEFFKEGLFPALMTDEINRR